MVYCPPAQMEQSDLNCSPNNQEWNNRLDLHRKGLSKYRTASWKCSIPRSIKLTIKPWIAPRSPPSNNVTLNTVWSSKHISIYSTLHELLHFVPALASEYFLRAALCRMHYNNPKRKWLWTKTPQSIFCCCSGYAYLSRYIQKAWVVAMRMNC